MEFIIFLVNTSSYYKQQKKYDEYYISNKNN